MSVTSIALIEASQGGSKNKDGKREWTASYRVTVSSPYDGPEVALRAPGLPIPGVSWYQVGNDIDVLAQCQTLTPKRETRLAWIVEAKWEANPDDDDKRDENGNPTTNPLEWRDKIDLSQMSKARAVSKATLRTAIPLQKVDSEITPINSAGVPFDPPLTDDSTIQILRITKYLPKFPNDHWQNYTNKINKSTFKYSKPKRGFSISFPRYTVLLASVTGSQQREGEVDYWEVSYELHYDPDGYRVDVLDKGFHSLVEAGDEDEFGNIISSSELYGKPPHQALKDINGDPASVPMLLDGHGKVLEAGKAPVYITYSVKKEVDFSALGL